MPGEPEPEFSTSTTLLTFVVLMSWGTVLLFVAVRAMTGVLAGPRIARTIILAIALGSVLLMPHFGKKEVARGAKFTGRVKLSAVQGVFVAVFLIAFWMTAASALGLFSN